MTSTRFRRVIAVAALLAAAPALAACSSGMDANTNKAYPPAEPNALIRSGTFGYNGIYIPSVFILGPAPGTTIPAGGSAPVYLTVVNNNGEPDALVAVAPADQQVTSVEGREPIAVPPGKLVNMGQPSPQLTVTGLKKALTGGESIPLTFKFQNAGDITMTVPVVSRTREYATLPPPAQPSPSPATAPSPGTSPTAGATPTGASPTPTS